MSNSFTLQTVLSHWQRWSSQGALPLRSQPLVLRALDAGLTNRSYLLQTDTEQWVLRLNTVQSVGLGINRQRELMILKALEGLQIAPQLMYVCPDFRYMIYRYIDGRKWTQEDLTSPEQLRKLTQTINRYQAVHLDIIPRNYQRYLQDYWDIIAASQLADAELEKQWRAVQPQLQAFDCANALPVLCHHDLIADNIIETSQGLRILDWEYAHLGPANLDMATATHEQGTTMANIRDWMGLLWRIVRDHSG